MWFPPRFSDKVVSTEAWFFAKEVTAKVISAMAVSCNSLSKDAVSTNVMFILWIYKWGDSHSLSR